MVRPHIDIPPVIHGAMQEFADVYGLTTEEAYIFALQFLLAHESSINYEPDRTGLLDTFLEKTENN